MRNHQDRNSGTLSIGMAVALLCAILLTILWLATFARINEERLHAVEEAKIQNANFAIALEEQTLRTFKGAEQTLNFIKNEVEEGDHPDLFELAQKGNIDTSLFIFLAITDRNGRVVNGISGLQKIRGNIDASDREYFKALREGYAGKLYIDKPVNSLATKIPVIPIAIALRGPGGQFAGAVVGGINPSYFTQFYQKALLGENGVLILAGTDGIVRARRSGKELSFGQDLRQNTLMIEQAQRPQGNILALGKVDGVPRHVSYRTLKEYPLVVAAGASQADLMAALTPRERTYYAWGGLASLLLLGFTAAILGALWRQARAARALKTSDEQFRVIGETVQEVIYISDVGLGRIDYISPAYERIWKRSCRSLIESPDSFLESIHPEDREKTASGMLALQKRGEPFDLEYRIVWPDGRVRWIMDRGFPIRDPQGVVTGYAGSALDITERKAMEKQLSHMATHDALTGLPNRVLCMDRLRQALGSAGRRSRTIGVLFVDLDRFKGVNDTLGHPAGDQLLIEVARRLESCVRSEDTVARLGGDEFAMVLSELRNPTDAAQVAKKVLAELAKPFQLGNEEVFVTGSIGIAAYPQDGADAATLLKFADAAMFRAKESGRNAYHYYTAEMNEQAVKNLQLETALRHALERNEFLLHYQPKAGLKDGAICGFEALLRWQEPGKGLVPPASFIPLLEDTGLIKPVGEWVINAACAQIRAWLNAGYAPVPVAVNLSARQFFGQDICQIIDRALIAHGIEARFLEVEITESLAMQDPEGVASALTRLKNRGIGAHIDDFGTGYSSLAYLKRFAVDTLKLDRSFTQGLPHDENDFAIASAVITMAHKLGLKVIAEGVETEEQRDCLRDNGCDVMQGYLLSKPLPAEMCERFLSKAGREAAEAARLALAS